MNKDNKRILQDFINFKKTEVNTKNQIEGYNCYIKLFLDSIKKPVKEIKEEDLIKFINSIKDKYKVNSMNCIKSMVHSFLYWYSKDNYYKKFPNIKRICKAHISEKSYSSEDMLNKKDVEKLVQSEYTSYWKAYWLLLFYGGFRPSEVCNLEWKDIKFSSEGAYIKVYVKKNKKEFEKFVPEDVVFYLKKLENNGSKYVFPTARKHKHKIPVGDMPLTRSGVYQRLVKISKEVLDKKINPYILRHSIATILYNRDDLKDSDVAQQMGHSKNMRDTYNNLSVEKLRERMKKIYIKAEELPPEKRKELEEEVETLKKELNEMKNKEIDNSIILNQLLEILKINNSKLKIHKQLIEIEKEKNNL